MPKMSKDSIKGLSPTAKQITFKAENSEGKEVDATFFIYPFTTDEKLQLRQLQEEANNTEDEEKQLEVTTRVVHMILRKSIEELTIDEVKQNIPTQWFDDIISKALEHEGVEQKEIEDIKKKAHQQAEQ